MTFEEIKTAIFTLDDSDQKRLITEVLLEIMPKVCTDEECLGKIQNFVNEESIRSYREQHMDGI